MALKNYSPSVILYSVEKGNSNYVTVGASGVILHSSDAWSWTYALTRTTQLNTVKYNPTLQKYIAAGNSGVVLEGTDANIKRWVLRSSNISFNLLGACNIDNITGYAAPFASTSALFHFNGADQSTTFTDSSSNNFTVTRLGNTVISTAQAVFGGASAYFDGVGDYLTAPDNAAWDFSGQFSIECWYMMTGNSGASQSLVSNYRWSFGTNTGWKLATTTANKMWFGANDGNTYNAIPFQLTGTTTLALNTWYHVAVTRDSSNVVRLFINGALEASATMSFNPINTQSDTLRIGCSYADGEGKEPVFGYIDELRIVKGRALYTSNFTVPTAELSIYTETISIDPKMIVVGAAGNFIVSPDLQTWYSGNTGTANQLNSICFDGTKYIAVGNVGTIRYSTDLATWTSVSSGTGNGLNSVAYGNGKYVAVGVSGIVCYSTDGINWTARNISASGIASNNLQSVTFNNNVFIAVGAAANLLVSTDGYSWVKHSTLAATSNTIYGVVSNNYTTVAVGQTGQIYRTRM